jgi:hypothetical protein
MTEGAIRRYQQNRGQLQTGKVDRELLEQLRHDPAPKIVQRTTGPYARRPLRPNRAVPIHSNPCGTQAIGLANGWTHGCAKARAFGCHREQIVLNSASAFFPLSVATLPHSPRFHFNSGGNSMNSIVYIVGLVVIIGAILAFLGLR